MGPEPVKSWVGGGEHGCSSACHWLLAALQSSEFVHRQSSQKKASCLVVGSPK